MEKEDEKVPILLELQPQTETETDVVISSNSCSDNEDEFTSNGHSKGVGWSSPLGYVKQLLKWMAIMKDTFGGPFVVFVMIFYGVNRGFAEAMKRLVSNYYWKDVQKMQPANTQSFMALSSIPWDIKPIYGLITDTFPIAGYQRWPYLVICGIAGSLCLWALAFLKLTPWAAAFLMAAVALCNAFPDVVADASLAQCSKIAPTLSSDLQVVSVFIGLLDIILVSRMNLQMHIPDQAFVLGDEALTDAISKIQVMPMLVLSSQICPAGIEATIFAFLMSMSNFGHTCGYWFGALLLKWLHVQKDDYSKLWLAVLIRSLMRLSPLLFLFLIPDCTVENIKPPCVSLLNDTQTMETAKDTELFDEVSVHDSN